nr:reverse transcriptase domain-containing protein [Tanacetum cinerariifolium]
MAEMLRAPTEGDAEAIVVPPIVAEQFELKHSLINMMTTYQFFRHEKNNPHDHIRVARRWLEKEPSRSIHTWEDLVSKFINEFFPPSRTTSLCNEISNFQQRFDESFHEAWDRYKDLLRACPHHGFTELHQLDTFYNALNPADQDSLNAAAGGNLLERSTQDVLIIIDNKSKVRNSRSKPVASQVKACDVNSNSLEIAKLTHAVNQETNAVTTAMTAILKQFQATQPPAPVKAVEETCITCGCAHPYYQYLAAGGNTFPEFRDNIQGYVSAAAVNYNQGNPGYRPPALQTQIDMVKNELRNEMKSSIQTSLSNQTNEIKNMMASLLQINTASTSGSGSLPSNTVANPKGKLKVITTRSGLLIDGPTKILKALLSNKEKLQELANTPLNDNCSAVILKKLPEKLGDPGKFLIPCGFSELKCKALADLGASINLMPLSVWKKLGLPELIPTRMTLELANHAICTPAGIARDVFIQVGKFTFPADFVIVDYESDPRVPLILGRPFLWTARALIDVHGEEMILRDGDERLTLNMRHDTSSYSNQSKKESINLINVLNNSSEDFLEDLFPNQPSGNPTFSLHPELTSPEVNHVIFDSEGCNILSEKLLDLDLHPPLYDNQLSGSTTYLLEEFADELPPEYDDNIQFDIESGLKEIEFLLYLDKDYSLKDSIDQKNRAHLADIFSDAENIYNDPFDSKGEKIKESKLLIDELDLPCDFHPPSEYDPFISQDFSRVDALPSTNNDDKIFNPGILIQEKLAKIITRVDQDKKLAISNAFLVLEDFDPPFYEPLFFKEVPNSKMLLPFSSKNEEKVFKPGIHTSEKVHSYFFPELSHQGYKVFKINQIFKSPMKIFLFYCGKDTHILAVPHHHFYPLDQFKYGGIGSSSAT